MKNESGAHAIIWSIEKHRCSRKTADYISVKYPMNIDSNDTPNTLKSNMRDPQSSAQSASGTDVTVQASTLEKNSKKKEKEIGGPKGLEPTRYGDWESKGRCYDF